MKKSKSKTDLILDVLQENERSGRKADLTAQEVEARLDFTNLDIESIKPRKNEIEYASVKVRQELYLELKNEASRHGIKQPGKFITLILETYLRQLKGG